MTITNAFLILQNVGIFLIGIYVVISSCIYLIKQIGRQRFMELESHLECLYKKVEVSSIEISALSMQISQLKKGYISQNTSCGDIYEKMEKKE